jgi:hypothetical protein
MANFHNHIRSLIAEIRKTTGGILPSEIRVNPSQHGHLTTGKFKGGLTPAPDGTVIATIHGVNIIVDSTVTSGSPKYRRLSTDGLTIFTYAADSTGPNVG